VLRKRRASRASVRVLNDTVPAADNMPDAMLKTRKRPRTESVNPTSPDPLDDHQDSLEGCPSPVDELVLVDESTRESILDPIVSAQRTRSGGARRIECAGLTLYRTPKPSFTVGSHLSVTNRHVRGRGWTTWHELSRRIRCCAWRGFVRLSPARRPEAGIASHQDGRSSRSAGRART
jgi:hypothetical protein